MQTMRKPLPLLVQLFDLTLIQLSNWRWSWRGMLVTGMLAPIVSITALGIFARDAGPRALNYVLVGNLVLSLMFDNQNKVAGNFAFMRAAGTLNYFAALPIHKTTLILASLLSFLALSLPSLLVTAVYGSLYLHIPLQPSIWLLLVIPLVSIPLSGIGALIGSRVRTPEMSSPVSLFLSMIMLGVGPVMIPPERLPGFLLTIGRFSPATYAASALRQALLGPVTSRLPIDLVVLAAFSLAIFWLVARYLDWRQVE
jgi:ABC-2 type transport system permease protein